VRALLGVALAALAAVSCSGAAATRAPLPSFDHVIVVVLENKSQSSVLGSDSAPNFNRFAKHNAVLSSYGGVAHPSLPNYLALVSGSTHGITTDCTSCLVSGKNLADTLEQAHLTWKAYAEGLPRPGFTGSFAGRYAKKHVPFLYFRDIVSNRARLRRVVPFRQFDRDLAARALPSFSLIVPNLCHDMHDCPIATGNEWLRSFVRPLLALPHTAVFVVFDEGVETNHVPAFVIGTAVRQRSVFAGRVDHYGLLRTIEELEGLPFLGKSASARTITGIWS
jgi:phospholipase C